MAKKDEGSYLWERCFKCGHRLALASTACPQCGASFDGRSKAPRTWPDVCACDRCKQARADKSRPKG